MSKLFKNDDDLRFVATHLDELEKSRSGRGIYFCFDTVKNGNTGFNVIKGIFPNNDTSTGLDKRDFNFLFESRKKRDEVYDTLSKEINEYSVRHDEEIQDGNGKDEDYVPEDVDEEGNSILGGTTTYIIIGAAAVILILLLWDNKKK